MVYCRRLTLLKILKTEADATQDTEDGGYAGTAAREHEERCGNAVPRGYVTVPKYVHLATLCRFDHI